MKKLISILTMSMLASALLLGCGETSSEDANIRARNLKTGEVKTFSAGTDVPDGYALCADEECTVPGEVPCELLGAEVCQFQPNCRIKVLSCTGGGIDYAMGCTEPAQPPETSEPQNGSAEDPQSDPAGCVFPEETEVCQVACISKNSQLCEELDDAQACSARSDCNWDMLACATCVCADNGQPCECPPCDVNAGICRTAKPETCEDLQDQSLCMARPGCDWGEMACPACDCPDNGQPCECPECLSGCYTTQLPGCQDLADEQACLADSSCEWGQFSCPPCLFDQPHDNGDPGNASDPMPCECNLSCRAKHFECPPVPAIAIDCPPDQEGMPIYDEQGCLIGWQCSGEPTCPPLPMSYPVCESGAEPQPVHDAQGCQIGWDCPDGVTCVENADCPAGFQCDFSGGTSSNGSDKLMAEGQCVPCMPVMCELYCAYGFVEDENGCGICSCNPPPTTTGPCKRTGCSGQICSDKDEITTCEYWAYYQCYDLSECTQNSDGTCGWTQNPAFTQCMIDMGQQ